MLYRIIGIIGLIITASNIVVERDGNGVVNVIITPSQDFILNQIQFKSSEIEGEGEFIVGIAPAGNDDKGSGKSYSFVNDSVITNDLMYGKSGDKIRCVYPNDANTWHIRAFYMFP